MLPTAGGDYYLGERGYGGVLLLQLDVFGNGQVGAVIHQQFVLDQLRKEWDYLYQLAAAH